VTPFEVWKDPNTEAIFYFSHSDEVMTTGILFIPPNTELPKHNRPLAYENLVQVSGSCTMTVFEDENDEVGLNHVLNVGNELRMDKGKHHIHANPNNEPSYTLYKAEGDITAVMEVLRANFEKLN